MADRSGQGPRTGGRGSVRGDSTTERPPYVDRGWEDFDPAQVVDLTSDEKAAAKQERRDYKSSRAGGLGTVIRFGIFTGVLASVVLGGLYFFARPAVIHTIGDWAAENPTALQMPFVPDIVRTELGDSLTKPMDQTDFREVVFIIKLGQTPAEIGQSLVRAGLITDARAFVFEAIERGMTQYFIAGRHVLTKAMTIDEIIDVLTQPATAPPTIHLVFREGLRIEQIVAKLEYTEANPASPGVTLKVNVQDYYQLATNPPQSLLSQYSWLKLPPGGTLEGFLFPATYDVDPTITALALIEKQLDAFAANAPPALFKLPPEEIYRDVQIASLVEVEATVASDRPLVAGVFFNRLDPKKWATGLLQTDPTLNYANDTVWLRAHSMDSWTTYTFWLPIGGSVPLAQVQFPDDLAAYNTYKHAGLPPGPIGSPGKASIQAALGPDTADGYFYFLAKNDGSGTLAFAKTAAEHQANLKKYGYVK
jgi:UPF0755 protein